MRTALLILSVLTALNPPLLATSFAPPERQIIHSANHAYEMVVDPRSEVHSVRRSSSRHKQLWSFRAPVWHHDYFVSGDGHRVVVVHWPFCQTEQLNLPAIEVYLEGRLERVFSYRSISRPRRYRFGEVGPSGGFWRVWRADAWQSAERVYIRMSGAGTKYINLTNGQITNA